MSKEVKEKNKIHILKGDVLHGYRGPVSGIDYRTGPHRELVQETSTIDKVEEDELLSNTKE